MVAKAKEKPTKARKSLGGRPPADPAKVAIGLRHLDASEPELAVKSSGASLATLYRAKAKRDAEAGAGGASSPAPIPTPLPAPIVAPSAAAALALPQGGAVSGRPDLLVLVRRILAARDPAALAELDEGLAVQLRGGEPDLATWLARPLVAAAHTDPLEAAIAGLDAAVAHAEALSPLHPKTATVLGVVANLAARVEAIGKGRPRVATRDEVTERIVAVRDKAVERIAGLTAERRGKLEADRAELAAWAAQELAPRVAAGLGQRLDAMLGGPSS